MSHEQTPPSRDRVRPERVEGVSRREAVTMVGAAMAAATVFGACRGTPGGMGGEAGESTASAVETAPLPALATPLYNSSVVALAEAIRSGELGSEGVVEEYLRRIDAVNPALNAVVQLRADEALTEARAADARRARGEALGPLHGVPMTIKDSLDTVGVISTGGTQGRERFVPERDATVVARLKGAGAILLGKTNTPELTLSFETDNLIYGRTNNPWDLARTPGGSSGGAAALIAAGGTPFDIGSDYGGSIRLPSHFCGIAGLKPTFGRVPRTGHVYPFGGVQDNFQVVGPMARYVDDLAFLLPILAGPDHVDPGVVPMPLGDSTAVNLADLRVAFHTDNGIVTPTPETIAAVRRAATALDEAVASVEERRPDGVEQTMDVRVLYYWDGGTAVRRLLQRAGTTESTLDRFTSAEALSAVELDAAVEHLYAFRSSMLSIFDVADLVVCPVNAGPAVPHGAASRREDLPPFSYTITYNLTGWPGAVVRCGTSAEGLPIGVQVLAAPGREDRVLAAAKFLETQLGGFVAPPI